MKTIRLFLAGSILIALLGCGDRASTPSQTSAPAAVAAHRYEVRDGMDYGYSGAISEEAKKSGQVAPKITMFRYAGERDGKHQVHATDGTTFTAIECASPCEVLKIMSFIDQPYLRQTVHVERYKNESGSLASAVFDDVQNGRLHQYGMERGAKRFQVWIDEKRGYQELAVKTAAAAPQIPAECLKKYDLTKSPAVELPRPAHCAKIAP